MGVFLQNHNICRRYQMPKEKGRPAVSERASTSSGREGFPEKGPHVSLWKEHTHDIEPALL